MIERGEQLVDGIGAEGVADLGSIEGNANGANLPGPVVGDIGEGKPLHGVPGVLVEKLRDHGAIL